jgi:hypothetical protein
MTSDTHHVLRGDKAEWERAERAVVHLIAARHSLTLDDGDKDKEGRPGAIPAAVPVAVAAVPDAPESESAAIAAETVTVAPESAAIAAELAAPLRPRWPTIILLSVVWISVALVVSAAIVSVAKLL